MVGHARPAINLEAMDLEVGRDSLEQGNPAGLSGLFCTRKRRGTVVRPAGTRPVLHGQAGATRWIICSGRYKFLPVSPLSGAGARSQVAERLPVRPRIQPPRSKEPLRLRPASPPRPTCRSHRSHWHCTACDAPLPGFCAHYGTLSGGRRRDGCTVLQQRSAIRRLLLESRAVGRLNGGGVSGSRRGGRSLRRQRRGVPRDKASEPPADAVNARPTSGQRVPREPGSQTCPTPPANG